MKLIQLFLSVSIYLTAFLGDYVVFRSKYAESEVFRAFSDSFVHAAIGLQSALLFFTYEIGVTNHACVFNVIICTVVSSLIDIDHAFVARSVHFKDMLNLKRRGILHCTSFWLVITLALLKYSHTYKNLNVYILSWMLILAYTSHHIRDGNRRGLWLYPIGHTSAINKYVYVISVSLLPIIFASFYMYTKPTVVKHTVINYNYV